MHYAPKALFAAAALALGTFGLTQSAEASTIKCGNKWFHAEQDGTDLTPTFCSGPNDMNDPTITNAGWILGAAVGDSSVSSPKFTFSFGGGDWTIGNTHGYAHVALSIKEGNGYAFYVLDTSDPLFGEYGTGNNSSASGTGYSHATVWYKGVPAIPLPATGLLLIGALGGFGLMRRKRAA